MIVLDTNVLSEPFKVTPEPRVLEWLQSLTGEVAITAISLAELLAGVECLVEGKRKRSLRDAIESALRPYRHSAAILPFDDGAATAYAHVLARRAAIGRPISTADAQIAAICLHHRAACATRNERDFDDTSVRILNPWAL